ncbi:MAG: ABC-2 family transporter protein [Firmicutes bacterium]|nr:ABC-2 family transporter protein [Bacillota bacterium]
MATYLELIRIRFLVMLAYRVNFYSGILTYLIYTGGYYFFWMAAYGARENLGGLSPTEMTTYLAVGWMARAFYFNHLDREIADEIRDGTVAVQLLRPVSYLGQRVAGALGEALFRLLFFSVPGLTLAALLFPVRLPMDPKVWLAYLAALTLAFVLNAQINLLVGLAAVWSTRIQGLTWARRLVVDLLSGLYLPLSFYPAWARAVLEWLPFSAISYVPSLIAAGGLWGRPMLLALVRGLIWAVVLGALVRLVWRRATRALTVHGG